ncbi:MAG: SRPBCC family protein [Deltaproteobacteria bacterium]|nr:SRPBCC family protein [Deltaproteobacteria bacterium]
MPTITIETFVRAPVRRVFDLHRSIDVHVQSAGTTHEVAVAGKTSGLMELGETVTWEATHFGIRQRLTTTITRFDPPHHFRDSMVRGAFRRFDHDHWFEPHEGGTQVRDEFDFEAPLGPLGWLAERLVLTRYMQRFLVVRGEAIQKLAEAVDGPVPQG